MSLDKITIRGAREHNLRNLSMEIPRDKLVVITGLSGSGKSSLAFDTIYAEGQRRYMESLSAYARQFMEQLKKPEVESIEGLSPSISLEQQTTSRNPRSTVGTVTEIYDYLRLLYAKIGDVHCYSCRRPMTAQSVEQMRERVLSLEAGTRIQVLAPLVRGRKGEYTKQLEKFRSEGFLRARIDGEVVDLDEPVKLDKQKKHDIDLFVDRLVVQPGKTERRLGESIQTALQLGNGRLVVDVIGGEELRFSRELFCPYCEISYPEIEPRSFSFNSPYGACPSCDGLGEHRYFDPERVITDASLSIEEGAIGPWPWTSDYSRQVLSSLAEAYDFRTDLPWGKLSAKAKKIILEGTGGEKIEFHYRKRGGSRRMHTFREAFPGIIGWLQRRFDESESDEARAELAEWQGTRPCEACRGARLRPESLAVTVGGKNIDELSRTDIRRAAAFVGALALSERQEIVAGLIVRELRERFSFLLGVGLDYLSLGRSAGTLSGGEAQRIRMATQLGSSLTGVLYVLDEPSIGLHPRDNDRLIRTLQQMRDRGNSVLVVEHDEATIRAADWVIDMGPGAGRHGGEIVAQGSVDAICKSKQSLTGAYLTGRKRIESRAERRSWKRKVTVRGARLHNLREIDAEIPVGVFTCVTGVSGSGKSSLIVDTLYPAAKDAVYHRAVPKGEFRAIEGLEAFDKVIDIDQSPIGRTPRSNPATYTGLFTPIREFFAQLPDSKVRGYGPGRFSFNVKGGRCEACRGEGSIKVEMHFLPDHYVQCDVCRGRRYNRETLEVEYKGKNIAAVLDLSVEEAVEFFEAHPRIRNILETLNDVGLGYIHLGQAATTLSGGEAQRIKLARELGKRSTGRTLYILDEPTTGLHFDDVAKLLDVLHRLVGEGNTVIVIEHDLDVIRSADWLIDLGPEGGDNGGRIVAAGTPEQVARVQGSHTGQFLAGILR